MLSKALSRIPILWWAAASLASAVGVVGAVGWSTYDSVEPTSGVRIARIEDWPEIKNGVPELVGGVNRTDRLPRLTNATERAAGVQAVQPTPDPPDFMPSSVSAGGRDATVLAAPRPPIATATITGPAVIEEAKPKPLQPEPDRRALDLPSSAPSLSRSVTDPTQAPAADAPVPQRKTAPDAAARRQPPKERKAAKEAERNKRTQAKKELAATTPATVASADPPRAEAPKPEEGLRVLGIPLPTGRKIKECLLEWQC